MRFFIYVFICLFAFACGGTTSQDDFGGQQLGVLLGEIEVGTVPDEELPDAILGSFTFGFNPISGTLIPEGEHQNYLLAIASGPAPAMPSEAYFGLISGNCPSHADVYDSPDDFLSIWSSELISVSLSHNPAGVGTWEWIVPESENLWIGTYEAVEQCAVVLLNHGEGHGHLYLIPSIFITID